MDKASSSPVPDLAEEFRRSIVANRKKKYEENALEKTFSTWSKLQDLQFYWEIGLPCRGSAATRKLVTEEKKYQWSLSVPRASDIFRGEDVCLLMFYKEQKVLRRIAFSDDFERSCTDGMGTWMAVWRADVDREINSVNA